MDVHADHSIEANHSQQVCNDTGADGFAPTRTAVLSSVSEVRNHGSKAICSGTSRRVCHQKQFQQVLGNRNTRRLEQIDVLASHALTQLNAQLAIREALNVTLARRNIQRSRDPFRQRLIS